MENPVQTVAFSWPAIHMALWVLALPLLSFLTLLLAGKRLPSTPYAWALAFMLPALGLSTYLFATWQGTTLYAAQPWFVLPGGQQIALSVLLSGPTILMLLVVTAVSTLVHLFSIAYMGHDTHRQRYFAYLGLFTFSMLLLVLAGNLLLLFVGWEMVGLSSFLLIGFWRHKTSATQAANKAFIINRLADLGFFTGLMVLFGLFGTFELPALQSSLAQLPVGSTLATVAGLALFVAAIGKSAQFPLFNWLPSAMEGPTPVSALIHAATMVAAGVFLLARVYWLLTPTALNVIAFTGAITALLAALAALRQHNIKQVLAYSTISQLGFMVMALGTGAYNAALFHLTTHAVFKAGLFLAAGAIIHALHQAQKQSNAPHFDAQDMRLMGGLRSKLPVVGFAFIMCSLALAGLPGFSGFLSKDAILTQGLAWAYYQLFMQQSWAFLAVPVLGFAAVLLTALYTFRMLFLVLFGPFRLPQKLAQGQQVWQQLHDRGLALRLPLIVLALGSLGLVFTLNPLSAEHTWVYRFAVSPTTAVPLPQGLVYWQTRLAATLQDWHGTAQTIATVLTLVGLVLAAWRYRPKGQRSLAYAQAPNLSGLLAQGWHLNNLYMQGIVPATVAGARQLTRVDKHIIDGLLHLLSKSTVLVAYLNSFIDKYLVDGLVNFMAYLARAVGARVANLQNGKIQSYLIWLFIGITLALLWVLW